MSRTSRTNQVLYFARLNLDKVDEADSLQFKQMYEENALHHIYAGAVCLVSELVDQYNLPSFKDLNELFARNDLPSELIELKLASSDSSSWLYNLIKQYERLILTGLHNNVNSGLISSQSDYGPLFRNYLIELENFSERMREHYQEN